MELTPGRVRAARILGMTADFVQIGLLPLFSPGWLSPLNDALDVAAGIGFVLLLGWHIAFLPTFITELVPFADIFPTWTMAVLFVTRGGVRRAPGQ